MLHNARQVYAQEIGVCFSKNIFIFLSQQYVESVLPDLLTRSCEYVCSADLMCAMECGCVDLMCMVECMWICCVRWSMTVDFMCAVECDCVFDVCGGA